MLKFAGEKGCETSSSIHVSEIKIPKFFPPWGKNNKPPPLPKTASLPPKCCCAGRETASRSHWLLLKTLIKGFLLFYPNLRFNLLPDTRLSLPPGLLPWGQLPGRPGQPGRGRPPRTSSGPRSGAPPSPQPPSPEPPGPARPNNKGCPSRRHSRLRPGGVSIGMGGRGRATGCRAQTLSGL